MEEVIKIFKQIQKTSGLNDKKTIISLNKDNELFKKCLRFLIDGNITTGLSDKKIHKKVKPSSELAPYYLCKFSKFEDVINYLEKNNTGKDEDIYEIQSFLSGHEENRDFYEQMITKKFRLGADAKLVNKCIPGLIPTFNVMLGTPIEKCNLKDGTWISLSRKLNGCRAAFVGNKIMTRQGKEYCGLEHIISDLKKLGYSDYFIDGELLYKNEEGLSDSEAFQKGTGIAMSKDNDKKQLKLVVFDIFPLEEFWNGRSKLNYLDRNNKYLMKLKKDIEEFGTNNLEVVQTMYEGFNHSEIWKWLDYAEEHDWEGIMINLNTPYECKRTKNLIKVKRFKEIDLRCIDINIATSGKYKGLIGSVSCKYGNSIVDVGSGFDDKNRKYYTENPNKILNHIISIKYKEETINKNGSKSLQFPIFIQCRFDKNIADDE